MTTSPNELPKNVKIILVDALVRLQGDLKEIEKELEPKGYTVLEACPLIVASPDTFYAVGLNKQGQATLHIKQSFPVRFNRKQAEGIVKNFVATNGNGRIEFKIFTRLEYYSQIAEDIRKTIAEITSAIDIRCETPTIQMSLN